MPSQIRVENSAGYGVYTKVTDILTGKEILGIRSVTIAPITSSDPITAELELTTIVDIKATAQFSMIDPASGRRRIVKSVTFDNDETINF
jgi:hypothetical protein